MEDLRLCFSLIAGADPRRPDVPPIPLDHPSGKLLSDLKVAWTEQWIEVPVASEIRTAMQKVSAALAQTGAQIQHWLPNSFNLSEILNLYTRMAAYINLYAQPVDRYNLQRSATQIFRTATQGDKALRKLGGFSRVLPELLNPSLKGYFEALTERDRFIAQLDTELASWDVWLTPVAATPAFTHCPAWSEIDVDSKPYPHAVANGAYTMPFNLSGHPAIVIPIGQTTSGLPIGMQIVGKRWKEMELLARCFVDTARVAQQLDAVIGGFRSPPGY
ncbi:amidase [Cyanobacteria bacterium FACHB-63]|nr:amidase [Cyanobacteria bacterium FACHB-63]